MNIRLQKYKRNRLAGMNQYNAARVAGYSESMALKGCHRLERSVKVGIVDALERAGITGSYRANELFKLTQATKIQSCDVYVRNEDGKMVVNENSNDFIEVPDNATRLNAQKHISELLGDIKSKVEHSGQVTFVKMETIMIGDRALEFDIGSPLSA